MKPQPVGTIEWMPVAALRPNNYNPNVQPPPEHRLLKVSLLEDGWTQPIVVFEDTDPTCAGCDCARSTCDGYRAAGKIACCPECKHASELIIIDGEHRWRCARDEPTVAAMTGGLVPIVRLVKTRAHLLMSTVRHNRARGAHRVKAMAEIVRELLERGTPAEDVCFLLQMEAEELHRLADRAGMPERVGRTTAEFSKGWIPE